jgi:hypothetical protein
MSTAPPDHQDQSTDARPVIMPEDRHVAGSESVHIGSGDPDAVGDAQLLSATPEQVGRGGDSGWHGDLPIRVR